MDGKSRTWQCPQCGRTIEEASASVTPVIIKQTMTRDIEHKVSRLNRKELIAELIQLLHLVEDWRLEPPTESACFDRLYEHVPFKKVKK